jgi:hypothetical protein
MTNTKNARTANKRFGARRGVHPQKVLSDCQAFAPARTFVKPRPAAKPPDVSCHIERQCGGTWQKTDLKIET